MEVSVSEALVKFPQGVSETRLQVKEFNYFRLLFMPKGSCCCIDNNVVRNCQSGHIPTIICGHKRYLMTERTRIQKQADNMISFVQWLGLS